MLQNRLPIDMLLYFIKGSIGLNAIVFAPFYTSTKELRNLNLHLSTIMQKRLLNAQKCKLILLGQVNSGDCPKQLSNHVALF